MVYNFRLADIGEGIVEGEISKWFVKKGDIVKENQPLVEVITEKVTVELPSPVNGKIIEIGPDSGKIVKVGETVVIIDDGSKTETNQEIQVPEIKNQIKNELRKNNENKKIIATPAVKRLAKELGINLIKVIGTGENGKIIEKDVKRFSKLQDSNNEERISIKGTRKTIAERLSKSSHRVVQAWIMEEIDMNRVSELKTKLKDHRNKEIKLTYMPFIIKAVIESLKTNPKINASLDEETNDIVIKRDFNIGIATDTEQGLVVPVIQKAQEKNIFELAKEINELVSLAKNNKLNIENLQGGTFTVTNIGSIGGISSIPIVNHPEVAILAVNKIMKKVVLWENEIIARDRVYLSLSFDHRVLDGADIARFLNSIKDYLQDPDRLIQQ
ncbi:MAG: branched-chain alpha-keto acid dehydrogenase subunit E2 [Thaumarchaeota archaeon]|nr:branched-chain alpha-keto acid dehydrogenase subunit E2 [Nitrososphaerota archaeon]|tara:strand:- start:291 stop:1445 length:1155 start_codon:yes stop_codon:yes gene_type:complete